MSNFEEKYPNNGLNRDDENRILGKDESRFILNLRSGASESDNVGAIENIKGNVEVQFTLPQGTNKCIGSEGDQTTHSNFYFIYNSGGKHCILRYFPEYRVIRKLAEDDPNNPFLDFKEYDLINDINVIGELLYWRSNDNPPRKINFTKADVNDSEKNQVWNWYLGSKYIEGKSTLELEISFAQEKYQFLPVAFPTTSLTIDSTLTKKEIAKDLATQINALSFPFIATACGEFVNIENTSDDYYTIVATHNGGNTAQVVPQNFYDNFNERTVDVIKHPPHCEPKATIKTDIDFGRNYIERKVFQIAARFIYDDDEKSTVSPYSVNIYNDSGCSNESGNNSSNYIEIDLSVFNELYNVDDLQTIKKIELFIKEGQFGSWKTIKTLEQYEFVDISGIGYDFYNDGIYNVVDQDRFNDPYSNVPQLSKNQEIAKDRLFYANNLEGYANTCIDANIDLSYTDVSSEVKPQGHSVSGFIFIRNAWDSVNKSRPIWKDDSGNTIWGGIGTSLNQQQTLPLDGFVVYLTGTDKKTISRQVQISNPVPQDANGVFVNPGVPSFLYAQGRDAIANVSNGFNSACYSTFTINDVPDGYYSLRVASAETTQEQLDSGSLDYQSTSTNVFRMGRLQSLSPPSLYTSGYTSEQQGKTELLIHVNGGNIDLIYIDILDLTSTNTNGQDTVTGYVVDNDIPYTGTNITWDFALKDTRVSTALLSFSLNANSTWGDLAFPFGKAWTDHNGYYFYGIQKSSLSDDLFITGVGAGAVPLIDYSLSTSYQVERTGQPLTGGFVKYKQIAVRITPGSSDPIRTKVKGQIENLFGEGIPNASVVSMRSFPVTTDANGEYEFWHYGILQTTIPNVISFDTLLIASSKNIACGANYNNQIYNFNFDYAAWGNAIIAGTTPPQPPNAINNYPTLIIEVPSLVGDTSLSSIINAMKRGWDGKFGIVYYDRGLRSGAVNTSKNLELHIPFYSEKDTDGQIKTGVPVLDWEVKHTPPLWATHWQWLRTRNTKVGSYFQWTTPLAVYATYDPAIGYNIATFSTGNRLGLSIENYITYQNDNPNVNLEIDINSETSRVRFIKDENGTTFSTYADVKVLDVTTIATIGTFIFVENSASIGQINAGTLFEVYNEVLDIEEDIYYEMGECFEIGTDSNGNKYHKGLSQDQDPLNPVNIPAKGTLRSGDSYYRFRDIPGITINNTPFIDDDGVSDFYKSEVENIGRPNGENPEAAQTWKPNQMRHGGLYVPDSKINELSRFLASDFTNLPMSYGDINKLQLVENILLSIHEFRHVSNYIGEAVVRKQDGSNEIIASTNVFGDYRAAKGITGTINPESVKEYKGNVYSYDLNKGLVNRFGADGLTQISDYKMAGYFDDKGKSILNNLNKSVNPIRIIGAFDSSYYEYILSFPEVNILSNGSIVPIPSKVVNFEWAGNIPYNVGTGNTSLIDYTGNKYVANDGNNSTDGSILFDTTLGQGIIQIENSSSFNLNVKVLDSSQTSTIVILAPGQSIYDFNIVTKTYKVFNSNSLTKVVEKETISFSEDINKWITFYSFHPEMFGIIDIEMISFKDGKLWVHDANSLANNFYGTQYTSQVEILFNDKPGQVKVYRAIGVESYHPWKVPYAKTPNGMETEIVESRFVRRQDSYFAPVMRDKNTPGFTDTFEALINGREVRDRTIKVLLENTETELVTLFNVSMESTLSGRHQK